AHAGTINGFSAYCAFYPKDSLTVVVLTNTLGSPIWSGEIARPVARLALSVPPETFKGLTPGERARVAGAYRVGPIQATVTAENDTLRLEVPPGAKAAYRYQGGDVFGAEGSPEIHLRFYGRGSRADRFTFEMGAVPAYDLVLEP